MLDRDGQAHAGQIAVRDIIDTARRTVPAMRKAGADIVIALCHTGIGEKHHRQDMENAAVPLAAVDGIDALLLGHTHGQFPDAAMADTSEIAPSTGQLHGTPAMMPGFYGTSLGVMDLQLQWSPQGWHVTGHRTQLLTPKDGPRQSGPARQAIEAIAKDAHAATLAQMRQPIAQTQVPIHSYFANVRPDMSLQIVADAMQAAVKAEVGSDLPVLAAVAPFHFGGRNGLGHFIDIPPGPITLRDAAAMFPFADGLCAVRRTGAQIKAWLERAASHYNQLVPNQQFQQLMNPKNPGYNCDALFGLTYEIDLRQPARFDTQGDIVAPDACRVHNIAFQHRPVRDDDIFVVATNSFRAQAGGGFPYIDRADILWMADTRLRDILINALRDRIVIAAETTPVWRFRPIAGAGAQFRSSPRAMAHLPDGIVHNGTCAYGLASFTLSL